ncbi:MAG: hypothetical protein ACOC5L_03080 [Halobacteriota archaeon]
MEEKTATYAIIGASIVGIIIVAFLVLTGIPSGSYFSELYFEDHEELPKGVEVGSKQTFDFTVASHEKNETTYSYNVTYNGDIIEKGFFTLKPGESETTKASFTPLESTLVYVKSENSSETNHFTVSRQSTGKILVVGDNGSVREIEANKSEISLVLGTSNVIWTGETIKIPIKAPLGEKNVHDVELSPNSKEEYSFNYNTKEEVDSSIEPSPFLSQNKLGNLSSYGFNIVNKTVIVKNDQGDISITKDQEVAKYRYEKKKVQVNVTNEEDKYYEIHFWIMVRDQ